MKDIKVKKPLLIWTLQRTGGTNLSNFLNGLTQTKTIHHEPFNAPRTFGHLTKSWLETKDREKLLAGVREVCSNQENIKHCVEKVPWAVSNALVEASVEHDYIHMFLYRENPTGRLLSMEYAERTRSWGPGSVLQEGQDSDAFVKPLDVAALIDHEAKANNRLNDFWSKLCNHGVKPIAVSFEQLYSAPITDVRSKAVQIAEHFSLPTDEDFIESMVSEVRGKGNQGTNDRYSKFVGLDELEGAVASLPKLKFANL